MSTPIITLEVAGKELKFAPTMVAYNSFINDMMPNDKVAPAHNYLKKIVCPESKEALDDLLEAAAGHLPAIQHAAPRLPFENLLLVMLLEEHKQVRRLKAQAEEIRQALLSCNEIKKE